MKTMKHILIFIFFSISFALFGQNDTHPNFTQFQLDSALNGTKQVEIPSHFNSNGDKNTWDIDLKDLGDVIKAGISPTVDTDIKLLFSIVNDSIRIDSFDNKLGTIVGSPQFIDDAINKPQNVYKKCDGSDLLNGDKVHQVQNLTRKTGYGVSKLDGDDCLGNNDEFYNASLKNYYANAAFGNYAIGEFSRVLNGLNNVTNGGADIIGSSSGSITNTGGDRNSIFSSVDVTLGGTKSTMLNSNTSAITSSNSLWSMINNSTINNTSNIFGHNIQYSTMTNNSYNNVIMNSYSNVYGVFNSSFLFGGDNATRLSGTRCFLNFNTMAGKTVSDDNEELFGTIRFSNLTNNRNSSLFVNNSTLTNNVLCFIAGEASTYVNNGQSTILGSRHSISNQEGGFVLGENITQSNHSYQVLNFGSSPVQYPTQGSSSSSIDFNDIMYNFGTGNNTDYRSALTIFRNGKVKINQTKHFSSGTHSYSDVTPITTLDVDGDRGVRLPKLTSAQISSISSPENGEELYCTDCTANDSTVGVKMVYQASTSTWKKLW